MTRGREALLRLIFAGFVAFAGDIIDPGSAWPLIWAAAMLLVQALMITLALSMRRATGRRQIAWREAMHLGGLGLTSILFAVAGVLFWLEGGPGGRMFALFMLASNAMHVVLRSADAPKELWISCVPVLAALQALPMISFVLAPSADRGVMGMMMVAANLLVARLVMTGWACIGSSRKIRQALDEANRERLRAEAASDAKAQFLDLMGHELRTPLNGVLGMAQAMSGAELSPEQTKRLQVIRGSGEILSMLVNDVLEFSRTDAKGLELENKVVDVSALAAEMERAFAPLAEVKGLFLEVSCLASAQAPRSGDPRRVRQVMRSLVSPAIKSAEFGAVSVVISGDAAELRLQVSGAFSKAAAGLGRPETWLEGEGGAAPPHGGVGLVLQIARDLARRMGGDLDVAFDPYGDVTVTARMALPVVGDAVGPDAADVGAERAGAGPAGERLRVLAAEDNPTNQLVLKTLLEQAGLAVHIVSDGEEAVAAWRSAPWDVVLMDIRMPRMDGIAATRAIRAIEAADGRPRTPIIAVTADAMNHQSTEYTAAGMDGLIPKPIQFAELAAVVAALAEAGPEHAPAECAASGSLS